ncbi:hypothetical protein KW790_01775 [Candidatus Parcubacteria bacterium]|nr:hypothetical protein [Candidatus Parcubacteria bacterium]
MTDLFRELTELREKALKRLEREKIEAERASLERCTKEAQEIIKSLPDKLREAANAGNRNLEIYTFSTSKGNSEHPVFVLVTAWAQKHGLVAQIMKQVDDEGYSYGGKLMIFIE